MHWTTVTVAAATVPKVATAGPPLACGPAPTADPAAASGPAAAMEPLTRSRAARSCVK